MANDQPSDPRRSVIYRLIRLVAVLDIAFGLAMLFLGPALLGTDAFHNIGLGLSIAGAIVFVFFTWLAARNDWR